MRYYTMNEVAMMTGFTTRTLRNYISTGILDGEKMEGVWKFSVDDFINFISNPNVTSGIKSKINAQTFDFLADEKKKENYICTILDFYVDDEESAEISDFFSNQMNGSPKDGARFSLYKNGRNMRVTLTGPEDIISDIMHNYYSR